MPAQPNPRTALITGAGSGIGLAVAHALVARGDRVILNGRTESKLRRAADRLAHPDRVSVAPADVTRDQTPNQLIQHAVDRFGRLDLLVNNAGAFASKPFTDYSPHELDTYLGYLRGTYLLTQAAVRHMRPHRHGAIVNISTILAYNGVAAFPASAPMASKGGITALTRNLAVELAADNIRINAVAPGVVPTDLYGQLTDQQLQDLNHHQPLGRYGTPDDIAHAALYLADANWVTGVVLAVDGGVASGGDGNAHITHTDNAAERPAA